ncbi:MAG: ricin-type beta-trefoil lectin domain protein [Saccharospirillaceae bacterium]|nr:ricin-type beta-trefoil lectin domain protein [Saccharospirillaceae bacterium]
MKKLIRSGLATAISFIGLSSVCVQANAYDTADWVSQVYQQRGDTTLRQMVIPGTHDSATYNFSSSSDLAPDANSIYGAAKGVVSDWGKTQSYNIYDMLQMGIRHFDLRILKHEGQFVNVHGLVGMTMPDVLAQVRQFSEEHPQEPIILEVAKTPAAGDMSDLLDLFDQYVSDRKPDASKSLANTTLNDLWADDSDGHNNNIIVIWASGSSYGEERGYFGSSQLEGTWADTESSGQLYERLLNGWNRNGRIYKGLTNAPQDKLFYSAFTFTPKDSTIIEDVFNIFSSGSILNWTRDWMRSYLGEWVADWEKQGIRPNIMTADFFEYTAMVPMAIRLNTEAPAEPDDALQYMRTDDVVKVWGDHGSGADYDGSVWRLRSVPGFYPLGDIPIAGYRFDWNIDRILVKDGQPGVAKPLGYNWVWNDNDSGADTDASIWRPIAPQGFVCLGDVTTTNHGIAPSTDLIRCVHESYVQASQHTNWKWNDNGSGGKYDVSLWDGHNSDGSSLNTGSMRANRGHSAPARNLFQLIKRDRTQEVTGPEFRELKVMGVCMDTSNKAVNGNNVFVHSCWNPATWQKWVYEEATGFIRNKSNPHMCLDATNGNSAGTSVKMWQCEDHINLKWDFVGATIRPRKNHNLALDVKWGTPNDGQDLWLWNVDAGVAQTFGWGN